MNLKIITNSWPSALELAKLFLDSLFLTSLPWKITLEQIFLTVGQNNYGNKIPFRDADRDHVKIR